MEIAPSQLELLLRAYTHWEFCQSFFQMDLMILALGRTSVLHRGTLEKIPHISLFKISRKIAPLRPNGLYNNWAMTRKGKMDQV